MSELKELCDCCQNIEAALWSLGGMVETLGWNIKDATEKPEKESGLRDNDLIGMVKNWNKNWRGSQWSDEKNLDKLMNQIVGSTIIYTEMNDYQVEACDSVLFIFRKDEKYKIVVFDAWHNDDPEWKEAPICARSYRFVKENLND